MSNKVKIPGYEFGYVWNKGARLEYKDGYWFKKSGDSLIRFAEPDPAPRHEDDNKWLVEVDCIDPKTQDQAIEPISASGETLKDAAAGALDVLVGRIESTEWELLAMKLAKAELERLKGGEE